MADPAFSGGVRVAAGDVDGDGFADLIVGSGPGGGSTIRIFSGATRAQVALSRRMAGFVGGVFVAAGDVNGDGYADVITGADAGRRSARARVRRGDRRRAVRLLRRGGGRSRGGVRVAAGDVTATATPT